MMIQTDKSVDPHSPTAATAPRSSTYGHGEYAPVSTVHTSSMIPPPGFRTSTHMQDSASARSVSDTGPFSGHDAAIMADAFRQALRKPDFADRPHEEGESPDQNGDKKDVLARELAEEGRDIRSVSSQRGVRVQALDDDDQSGRRTPTSRKPS